MTPEREAEIRKWLRPSGEPSYEPSDTMIRELLAILDVERAARLAAEKERDQLRKALEIVRVHGVFLTYDPRKTTPENDKLQSAYRRVRKALDDALAAVGETSE